MAVELIKHVQDPYSQSEGWRQVEHLAAELLEELNDDSTLRRIHKADRPGSSSANVQAVFRPSAERFGFESERTGLFSDSITGLRPDYFLRIGETDGEFVHSPAGRQQ